MDSLGDVTDPLPESFADVTDLVIIAHGWNNNEEQASDLFARFFAQMAAVDNARRTSFRGRIGVLGVIWPSKRFDLPATTEGAANARDAIGEQLAAQLDTLVAASATPAIEAKVAAARAQLDDLSSSAAQGRFVRGLLASVVFDACPRPSDDDVANVALAQLADEDDESAAFALQQLMFAQHAPIDDDPFDPVGGALGNVGGSKSADSVGQATGVVGAATGSILAAALNLANLATYATMKERAGIVGRRGLARTIGAIATKRPDLRLHLVGHSFGGRMVTSAVAGLSAGATVNSIALLQAAFSHNGLAAAWDGTRGHDGLYRRIIADDRVSGTILVTHSRHDAANALAYPMASRLLQQVAAVFGGPKDPFGAMGANGAQRSGASSGVLLPVGGRYPAGRTKIRNLCGDGPPVEIRDHGDVAKPEIAYAILDAIAWCRAE